MSSGVVGGNGTVLHWNGATLAPVKIGTLNGLLSICGSGPGDIRVAGFAGTILAGP